MDVFHLRHRLFEDYTTYANSFIHIQDQEIREHVEDCLRKGVFWPDALIQLNPTFKPGAWIEELTDQGILHPECSRIFRKGKEQGLGTSLRLYQHQLEAIQVARRGTLHPDDRHRLGKSLAYIVPIVITCDGQRARCAAIVVYP
jgi:ATP-dependent helicase YprA (DUF1998 family)